MDETFGVWLAGLMANHLAVMAELGDVAKLDAIGRTGPRQKEMPRVFRIADRNVAKRVHHLVVGKDPVCRNEVFFQLCEIGHHSRLP